MNKDINELIDIKYLLTLLNEEKHNNDIKLLEIRYENEHLKNSITSHKGLISENINKYNSVKRSKEELLNAKKIAKIELLGFLSLLIGFSLLSQLIYGFNATAFISSAIINAIAIPTCAYVSFSKYNKLKKYIKNNNSRNIVTEINELTNLKTKLENRIIYNNQIIKNIELCNLGIDLKIGDIVNSLITNNDIKNLVIDEFVKNKDSINKLNKEVENQIAEEKGKKYIKRRKNNG